MSYSASSKSKSHESGKSNLICYCRYPAPLRTANTPWNRGKKFFGCSNYKQKNGCDFFRWADEADDGIDNHHGDENGEELMIEKQLLELLAENRILRIENKRLERREVNCLKAALTVTWFGIILALICFAMY